MSKQLLCSNYARTSQFGRQIFFVQKSTEWSIFARRQRLERRKSQNGGKYMLYTPIVIIIVIVIIVIDIKRVYSVQNQKRPMVWSG